MKNDMTRFLTVVCIFGLLLIVSDRILARVEDKLYARKDNKINYAARTDNAAQIVILGSSRASHHYVPAILADSLDRSCVNLGTDGQGIFYNYALFHLLLQNDTPEIIIYELSGFDWMDEGERNYSKLDDLAPLYGTSEVVDQLIGRKGKDYRNAIGLFHSYRYNGRLHNVFVDTHQTARKGGYLPLYGTWSRDFEVKAAVRQRLPVTVSLEKVSLLKRMAEECRANHILLIVAISPSLQNGLTDLEESVAAELCGTDIPYFNYKTALSDYAMFQDRTHMNCKGAEWYSSRLAGDIKKMLNEGPLPFGQKYDQIK